MVPNNYRHQIIRWNGNTEQPCKYQLKVAEVIQNGQTVYRASWTFSTLRGLIKFVSKHFPESDLLDQIDYSTIQFKTSPAGDF